MISDKHELYMAIVRMLSLLVVSVWGS